MIDPGFCYIIGNQQYCNGIKHNLRPKRIQDLKINWI